MEKQVSVLLSLGLSLTSLAACSGWGASPNAIGGTNQKETKSNEPLKLKMAWALYNELPDMNNNFWTEFKKRTNINLDVQWIPNANYQQKLELMKKVKQIFDFYDSTTTADFLHFGENGVEGVHYNMENGYPKMTELGSKEMVVSS